ncbi:amidase [Gordonia sp. VNK21]|uniref:amidase n=1 Tax=Gordonia sp. VNK21 TaxID=3382483 RepID=UPI0038D38FFD
MEERTIAELQRDLGSGAVTAERLVRAYLRRIRAYDTTLNSMVSMNAAAVTQAVALDRERRSGRVRGPLHGIPVILKDNYDTADMPTSAGSILLRNSVPPRDATVTKRLRDAGAVILGKANMSEWAIFISTDSSVTGQTRNPYGLEHNPGGSSGGTGAAIAASFAAVGLGSDTSGSIRIPSAYNGLVGLRPTKGLTSIGGVVPLCPTQDVVGPMGRTAADVAVVMDVIAGFRDERDPATAIALSGRPGNGFVRQLSTSSLEGQRIGLATSMFRAAAAPSGDREVDTMLATVQANLRRLGATLVEVPEVDELESLAADTVLFEFEESLNTYLRSLGPERRLRDFDQALVSNTAVFYAQSRMMASKVSPGTGSAAYRQIMRRRAAVRQKVLGLYRAHDVSALLYPTTQTPPPPIPEERLTRSHTADVAPVCGLPAVSIPGGLTRDGLPLGFDLMGTSMSDARLLSYAHAYQHHFPLRRVPRFAPALD